jgi:hypothetical protein
MRNRIAVIAVTAATLLALWVQPALAVWRPGH